MSYEPQTTTRHETIRTWIEQRGGKPARLREDASPIENHQAGSLRVDFGDAEDIESVPPDALESLSWEDFFESFEEDNLLFLYQEETEKGETSHFHKFVRRS